MLDRVPLARPRGQVMHRDGQPGLVAQLLQFPLPQPHPHPVRAAPVGRDGQARGRTIARLPDLLPPAPDGLHRKGRRVVVLTDPDPAGVGRQIVDAMNIPAHPSSLIKKS